MSVIIPFKECKTCPEEQNWPHCKPREKTNCPVHSEKLEIHEDCGDEIERGCGAVGHDCSECYIHCELNPDPDYSGEEDTWEEEEGDPYE